MAKDPAQRPPDARAFLEELEEAARRRFGGAWLHRASIAGVVAGVVGTPAVVTAATGTTAAAPTIVVDTASIVTGGAGGAAARSGRSGRGKLIALATAAAVVVVAGGVAAAVTLTGAGGSDDDDPAASSTIEPSPSPTEASLEEQLPGGTYRFTRTLLSNTYDQRFPKRETRTWTVDLSRCSTASCRGDIKSSSGSTFTYTWDGSQLDIKVPGGGRQVLEGPCVDDETGEEVPGSRGRVVQTLVWVPLAPTEIGEDGVPVRYEGSQRQRTTYEGLTQGCRDLPADRASWRTTLVRLP